MIITIIIIVLMVERYNLMTIIIFSGANVSNITVDLHI